MESEIKYFEGGIRRRDQTDPKAVVKLRDCDIPKTKTELQSFFVSANYYYVFLPCHAKLVAPLHPIAGTGPSFLWARVERQQASNSIKVALTEATALALRDTEGEVVLNTDASGVAFSGILYQWQGPPESLKLRPIVFESKKLTPTQAKYGL